jgi:hypothetical protein
MNDQPRAPKGADDDWLDALLRADGREHRSAYLDDDGFTSRTMAALPPLAVPVALPAWRKPALAVLWAAAGIGIAVALPGAVTDVSREILRVILGQPVSFTGIGTGVIALGAATWAAVALALRDD